MDNHQQKTYRDWSTLPPELLFLILTSLNNTETDRRRLRSVCHSWRSSLSPPIHFPIATVFPCPDYEDEDTGYLLQSVFYLISSPTFNKNTTYTTAPSNFWVTRVQEKPGPPNLWTLQNPISRASVFRPLPHLKARVNFLDYRISEVARSYSLPATVDSSKAVKIVMLPKWGAATSDNFSLLARSNDGNLKVFKCGGESWTELSFKGFRIFLDVIAFEGMFYAADWHGDLISIDPKNFEAKEMIQSRVQGQRFDGQFTYLVESCGKLYLINKVVNLFPGFKEGFSYDAKKKKMTKANCFCNAGHPLGFRVYVLGYSCSVEGQKKKKEKNYFWEPVTSLGDRVFFVSEYVSFSVKAEDIGWCRGDCIFFTQEGFMGQENYGYDHDEENCYDVDHRYESESQLFSPFCGLYTLEDGGAVSLNLPSKCTNIFWPVPAWLTSN